MNAFIESLKRLYANGVLGIEDIARLYAENKITADEKNYILQSA